MWWPKLMGCATCKWVKQLLTSGLVCTLHRPEDAYAAAALGAARLAWLADGGTEQEVCQPLPTAQAFAPQPCLRQLLAERYSRYRGLYPALKDFF